MRRRRRDDEFPSDNDLSAHRVSWSQPRSSVNVSLIIHGDELRSAAVAPPPSRILGLLQQRAESREEGRQRVARSWMPLDHQRVDHAERIAEQHNG